MNGQGRYRSLCMSHTGPDQYAQHRKLILCSTRARCTHYGIDSIYQEPLREHGSENRQMAMVTRARQVGKSRTLKAGVSGRSVGGFRRYLQRAPSGATASTRTAF